MESETVRMQAPVLRRPMALTPAELGALELGLATLRLELPPNEAAVAVSARDRVVKIATSLDKHQRGLATHVVREAPSEAERNQLSLLRTALAARKKARLQYRTGGAAKANSRTVHPYGLINIRGMWYLLAYCDKAASIRIFRLDRMAGVAVLDDAAVIPKTLDLKAALVDGRALVNHSADVLRVRYGKDIARWIREEYDVKEQRDGSVVVEHPLLDDAWAVRHVLGYGAEAVVLEPPRIREMVTARLKAMLAPSR
jgi:proteasome accessory factor C